MTHISKLEPGRLLLFMIHKACAVHQKKGRQAPCPEEPPMRTLRETLYCAQGQLKELFKILIIV